MFFCCNFSFSDFDFQNFVHNMTKNVHHVPKIFTFILSYIKVVSKGRILPVHLKYLLGGQK